ncbi:MAG: DUF3090 domain-containing protein [Actinomycetota bacterium]
MDLEQVDKVTAGAVGEPGERTFFLQVRSGERLITIAVEKEQVELLSSSILEILATVDKETGDGPPEEQLALEPPLEPLWRAGRLSIGYSEERDLMLLELEEYVAELEGQDEEAEAPADAPEPDRLRVWASREQMLALSRHGAAVAARGRPKCQFCGNPIDPEGHTCPAMNGHRSTTRG